MSAFCLPAVWCIRDSEEGASWKWRRGVTSGGWGSLRDWRKQWFGGPHPGRPPEVAGAAWPGGRGLALQKSSPREGASAGVGAGAEGRPCLPGGSEPGRRSHGHQALRGNACCRLPSLRWALTRDASPRAPGVRSHLCTQPFPSSLTRALGWSSTGRGSGRLMCLWQL